MSGFNPKAKLAYFKDNVRTPEEQEDFSMQQYYYSRDPPPGPNPSNDGPPHFPGYPPLGGNYGPGAPQHMAHPMGIMRQQSNPAATGQSEGYPAMPQQARSISHGSGLGASPARGPASGMGAGPFSVMDSSNFPSLNPNPASSRYGVMSAPQYGGPMGVASAYGLGPDGSGGNAGQPQNFSIQNEDFPALPGSGPGAPPSRPGVGGLQSHQFGASSSSLRDESGSSGGGQGGAVRGNLSAAIVGSSRASNATPQAQSAPQGTQQAGSRAAMGGLGGGATGMQLQQLMNSVETDESSGSATRPKDTKYGLLGLLDVIKMTDRDLNTLALGTDLTTFGLNLSSTDSLYLTFSSPFSDAPAPPEIPYFSTPSCYLMQAPSLKPDHLNKMHMETLFYMFYSMPRDQLQSAAAIELYRREWWFHADLRLWMKMRSPDGQAAQGSTQFVYFDVSCWEAKIYSGNSLRTSGFLPEEDIAMMLKAQQASGAVQNSANYPSMTSGTNNTALNQGSQPVSGVGSIERVGSIPSGSVGSRPGISGGQQLRS